MSSNCRKREGDKGVKFLGATEEMAMFDDFPPVLRQTLANANEDYSIYQVHWNLKNQLATVEFIVAAIQKADEQCGS